VNDSTTTLSPPSSHLPWRRNYWLGQAYSVCNQLGWFLTDPGLVLSVLIRTLGGSHFLVGLVPALRSVAFFLPQMLVAGRVQSHQYKRPVLLAAQAVRVVFYSSIAITLLLWAPHHPTLALAAFFLLYVTTQFTGSIINVTRLDVLGKIIAPQSQSRFFAQTQLWVGLIGLASGVIVRFVLKNNQAVPAPAQFATLFFFSAVSFAVGGVVFWNIVEPPSKTSNQQSNSYQHWQLGPTIWRVDPNYRRLVLTRLVLGLTHVATPFYAVYAVEELGVSVSMVGLYLSLFTGARLGATPLWDWIARRRGTVIMWRIAVALAITVPIIAIGMPRIISPQTPLASWLPSLYATVFLLNGASFTGRIIAIQSLELAVSPEPLRPIYIGFLNSLAGIASLVPMLGGPIVEVAGYSMVFTISGCFAALALIGTIGLEPRVCQDGWIKLQAIVETTR